MRTVDLIIKKRDGGELEPDEIRRLVRGCVAGEIPDYQLAAWLMAVYFRGLSFAELGALTDAMARSGEVHDLSSIPAIKVDKHSTGGVGDKVSLVLAPLIASVGVPVPMVAGRGLGHTGGTLDKLESIPGFSVSLSTNQFRDQVARIGVAIVGQTQAFVPADRLMYALRDVTGTVESIPLIAASIMSKKIAAGIDALVMDVKTGNGAFMAREEDARQLARTLVAVGREVGLPVIALLTDMNQPLGRAVGNAIEIVETIETLKGNGPGDLLDVTLALGAEMLLLAGAAASMDKARDQLNACLRQGKALDKFAQMVEAQGGNPRIVEDLSLLNLHTANEEIVHADRDGFISAFNTRQVGVASMILGAGRETIKDTIDPTVGFLFEKKLGERVCTGDVLCRIYYRDIERMVRAREMLRNAIEISGRKPVPLPLIKARIDHNDLKSAPGG